MLIEMVTQGVIATDPATRTPFNDPAIRSRSKSRQSPKSSQFSRRLTGWLITGTNWHPALSGRLARFKAVLELLDYMRAKPHAGTVCAV